MVWQSFLNLKYPALNYATNTTDQEQRTMREKCEPDIITVENVVTENYSVLAPWQSLSHIGLSAADKEFITAEKQLTNKHINYAQALLKSQFDKAKIKTLLHFGSLKADSSASKTLWMCTLFYTEPIYNVCN